VRILSDWSEHATYGVNAYLADVPLESGVNEPDAVTVRNEFEDTQTARKQIPDDITGTCLLWSLYDDPISQQNPSNRPWPPDASVPVLCRVAFNKADTADGARDASVIFRALWRSLGKIMNTSAGNTARSRNQVQLLHIESMDALTLYEARDNTLINAAVLVRCRVRDLHAAT
jgi:hypothetical protein